MDGNKTVLNGKIRQTLGSNGTMAELTIAFLNSESFLRSISYFVRSIVSDATASASVLDRMILYPSVKTLPSLDTNSEAPPTVPHLRSNRAWR